MEVPLEELMSACLNDTGVQGGNGIQRVKKHL